MFWGGLVSPEPIRFAAAPPTPQKAHRPPGGPKETQTLRPALLLPLAQRPSCLPQPPQTLGDVGRQFSSWNTRKR